MKLLRILLLAVAVSVGCGAVSAQSFKVTDYEETDLKAEKLNKVKLEVLGTKINLSFFRNDLKVTIIPESGKRQEILFQKLGKDTYTASTSKNKRLILTLQRRFDYITGGRMDLFKKDKKVNTMYFDRY